MYVRDVGYPLIVPIDREGMSTGGLEADKWMEGKMWEALKPMMRRAKEEGVRVRVVQALVHCLQRATLACTHTRTRMQHTHTCTAP
jgi:hypothetical protein